MASLYRLPNADTSEHEGLVSIAVKVPQAVFCLLAELQFHELTTQLPRRVWIAMLRGSHTRLQLVATLKLPPCDRLMTTHRSPGFLWGRSWGPARTLERTIHKNQDLAAGIEQVLNIE